MAAIAGSLSTHRESRQALTVGDIFRTWGPSYAQQHVLSPEQTKVMRAIEQCRTASLGGHVYVCASCNNETPMYNSCRNRHCPTCQSLDQAQWIAERQQRVLPVRHFHVVFTLPHTLGPLAMANPEIVYALLLKSAGETLIELGRDPKRLGAQLGVTTVLHTWTRDLRFHPHAHCVVTAGGLAIEGEPRWIHTNPKFLFPVRVMSRLFRGKFLAGLRELDEQGKLRHPDVVGASDENKSLFDALLKKLYATEWVAYSKAPFAGPEHVFRYLGRYTHRVGISNQRLQAVDELGVRFYTKDGQSCTLMHDEFIRRFLLHVLPRGFHKIRHYGLLSASNVNTKLEQARALLTPTTAPIKPSSEESEREISPEDLTWQERLHALTGIDVSKCAACGAGTLQVRVVTPVRSRTLSPVQWDLDTS